MSDNNYRLSTLSKADKSSRSSDAVASKKIRLLCYLMCLTTSIGNAQEKILQKQTPLNYEEIPVTVFIDNVGSFDLNVLYTTHELVYIPIEDLFKPLKIACQSNINKEVLEGFIEQESNRYKVDYTNNQLIVGPKIYTLEKELIQETGLLYLESSKFKEVFGIDLSFNFRSLSIKLKADFELPLLKQARIEKMQSNIAKIKGNEVVADTTIRRNFHLLKLGTLDWNLASYQNWKGASSHIGGLGIGTELLYGEATISANFNNQYPFNNRQLNYLWRWIDNEKTFIKQAQVGKIAVQSIASLNAPLIGATVRNTPTTIRKATGSYTINETTEPNWKVELYINNVLVDFTTADAAGNFIFKVPIVYGFTTLTLKYYGPMGEERVEERVMNVPYTVMPVNELEYGVTAGVLQDSTHGKYGKGEFYYGLSRKLTIGGGLEYLSSITDGKVMPFAKATLQPFSKLTLNAEYVHGVRSRGLINYYFSRDILLEIDYANYVDGQRATLFNASEELKAKLSIPYRMHQLNGYLKIDYSQLKYASFDFNYAYVMLSANYKQWNANSALQLNWIDQQNPYMTNDLALSYRLKKNIIMRPSIKYNGSDGRLISYKTEIEKSSYLGHFGVSYEKNKLANNHFINLSFKYDLSFARVSTVATISKANFTTSESAQGSVAFDRETNYVHTSKNTSNGKGGLLLYPFLDINQNGIFDKDEKLVKLSAVTISGGKALFSEKDSIIRIPDLNAFTNYNLSFSDTDLDNIAWRFKHKTYQVLIDPNQFKRIDIPIHIVGEMSGMVYKEHQNTLIGIARILVKIYQKNNNQLVAETLSEPDGYSYFLGLKPGDYKACIDADQLSNLNLIATPDCRYFTIKSMLEGDIVSGLDFNLSNKKTGTPINKDTIPTDDQMVKPKVSPSQEEIKAKLSNRNDEAKILYVLQLMASRKSVDINDYFSKLRNKIPSLQITETHQKNGWYRYNAGIYSTRTEAVQMARKIKDSGWKDCFVAPIISVDQIDQDPPVEVSTQQNITDKKVDSPSKMSEIEINKPVDSFSNNYKPWYALNTYRKEQGEIVYVLQLMASRSPVNINTYFSKILAKIPTLEIAETHQKDGWVRYHVGIYKTPQEAMTKVHQLKASGWKEFFIAPYITIQQPHFNK